MLFYLLCSILLDQHCLGTILSGPPFIAAAMIRLLRILNTVHMIFVQIVVDFRRIHFDIIFYTTTIRAANITWAFVEEVQKPLNIRPQFCIQIFLLTYTLRFGSFAMVVSPNDDSINTSVCGNTEAWHQIEL